MLGIITLIVESLLRPRRVYKDVVARGFDRVPIDLVVVTLSFLTYPLVRSVIRLTSGPSFVPSILFSLLSSLVTGLLIYAVSTLADYFILRAFKTGLTLKRIRTAFVWTLPLRLLGTAFALFVVFNVPNLQYWHLELPFSITILVFLASLPLMVQIVRLMSEALNLKLRYAVLLVCFNVGLHELVVTLIDWADKWAPALERGMLG